MAKLILTFHGNEIEEFELSREYTTIGRKSDNDIQIDNLAVSGHHARVIKILSDYFLEDLDSTNGTSVNGSPVKKHPLSNGDSIDIGKHQLRFVNEDQDADADELEKTVVMRPSAMSGLFAAAQKEAPPPKPEAAQPPPAAPAAKPAEPAAAQGQARARLQILSGPNAGRELLLTKEVTTLGKKGLQVAAITHRANGYFLVHIEGGPDNKKYPLVNGQPAGPQAYHLQDQDVIEMAGIKMGFFI